MVSKRNAHEDRSAGLVILRSSWRSSLVALARYEPSGRQNARGDADVRRDAVRRARRRPCGEPRSGWPGWRPRSGPRSSKSTAPSPELGKPDSAPLRRIAELNVQSGDGTACRGIHKSAWLRATGTSTLWGSLHHSPSELQRSFGMVA